MSAEHKKYKALYLLSEKIPPKTISDTVDLSYATVLRYKKEYEDAVSNDTINELLNFPKAILEDLLDVVRENAPVNIDEQIGVLTAQISGLERLRNDLQLTACNVTAKIRSMTMAVESADELKTLTSSLCAIQDSFFAVGTNVNIQNNIGAQGDFQYGGLLDDKPKNIGGPIQ